jgi:hypothetical protein
MAFAEPLDVFFSGIFSITATWKGTTAVSGVFWNAAAEQFGIEARVPKFETKTSNLAGLAKGDALTVDSVSYKIQDWEYDATGAVVTLDLEKQ